MNWHLLLLIFVSCNSVTVSQESNEHNQEPTREQEVIMDSRNVEGMMLKLVKAGERSKLVYGDSNRRMGLEIEPPCAFVLDGKSKVMWYEIEGSKVVLISGGPANKEGIKDPVSGKMCGTQIQAIMIRNKSITRAKVYDEGQAICWSQGLDEKNYWVLSRKRMQ